MKRKICAIILVLSTLISSPVSANASETDEFLLIEYPQVSHLPNNGLPFQVDNITNSSSQSEYSTASLYTTVYGFTYTPGSPKYGAWRTAVSGGSNVSDITLTFDRTNETSYNISFTATVSGEYTSINKNTIGSHLGVELGVSKSYSVGSGATVTVPKGSHYTIIYRPVYYVYTVVETEYLQAYLPGYGWDKNVVGTKTCTVAVFSHWDFSVR